MVGAKNGPPLKELALAILQSDVLWVKVVQVR